MIYIYNLNIYFLNIYLYCIYLLMSSSVLFHAPIIQPFHPQPSKRKGRRRVHDIRWTWSTSKRQAFKIEPGKRLLVRTAKPHHLHPTRKRRAMGSVIGRRPKAPLKDINLPPLQRQVNTSPTTFRAFRKITMRSEKRKARWRRAVDTLPGRSFFLKTCAYHPCDEK